MKKIYAALTVAGIVLAPLQVLAETERLRQRYLGVLLNDIALNGSAAVRTFTVSGPNTWGMAKLTLTVIRTRTAGTDLTMTCTQSPNGGTNKGTIQVCEYAAATGTCTHYTNTWKSATSSTETLTWEIGILGYGQLDCTFASTSGGADDKLTVLGMLVSQ